MFGYMTANYKALSKPDQDRYRHYYCGLCRALGRYGNISRLTLNNDMTFLLILLSSLYEPAEETRMGRCLPHPIKRRAYISSEISGYCADMTILLSYLKCMDDRTDEGSLRSKAGIAALANPYQAVKARYPGMADRIAEYVSEINAYEAMNGPGVDIPANLSGKILGEVFQYREDDWGADLYTLGESLGRFVYLMDAYDDLASDIRKGRYNALREFQKQSDFESFCEESLTMMIADCAAVFETLPLENHLGILRNVLYSGVWMRYWQKACKTNRAQEPGKETEHEQKSV